MENGLHAEPSLCYLTKRASLSIWRGSIVSGETNLPTDAETLPTGLLGLWKSGIPGDFQVFQGIFALNSR